MLHLVVTVFTPAVRKLINIPMQKIITLIGIFLLAALTGFSAEWVAFDSKEGGFKILFPRQPVVSDQEVATDHGSIPLKMFMHDASKFKDDNELYSISYIDEVDSEINSDMPDESADQMLHASLAGAEKNISGQMVSENVISLKGYRGREGKINVPEGSYVMRIRVYLVNRRLYLLQIAYKSSKENNASIDKFLSSFDVSAGPKTIHEKVTHDSWATLQKEGFKIAFPELPEEVMQDVNSKIGVLKLHTFTYETGKYKDYNEAYEFMYSDYPEDMVNSDFKESIIDTFFNGAIRGMLKKERYKKLSEKKITHKDYPGRSVKIGMSEEKAVMNCRLYLVHNRVYILEVICYDKNENNAYVDKFFNSFALAADK